MTDPKISHIDPEYESELKLFDKDNPDILLFNLIDDEGIKLSGSKLFYFKYYPSDDHNDVYMENRNKMISKDPIVVYAHYDPLAIEESVNKFGLTLEMKQVFSFNKDYIQRKLGRLPISGDIIKTKFQDLKFRIFEVQLDLFTNYNIYHVDCTAEILRDSEDVVDERLNKVSDRLGNIERG